MALRDHTTDSAKLSEDMIESIVAGFVKYDPMTKSIHLLPKSGDLSNEKKLLLFLVAMRGWFFVLKDKDKVVSDASPTEIEKATGIKGGTLRPILRSLTQLKILTSKKGRYEVPAHNLVHVKELIRSAEKPSKTDHQKSFTAKSKVNPKKERQKTRGSKYKPALGEKFNELVEQKWFKGGKTTSDLKKKLDEMTVFPPIVQLPAYLLKAYRTGLLTRKKENVKEKNVWVYYQG